jgi:hypothetical protein
MYRHGLQIRRIWSQYNIFRTNLIDMSAYNSLYLNHWTNWVNLCNPLLIPSTLHFLTFIYIFRWALKTKHLTIMIYINGMTMNQTLSSPFIILSVEYVYISKCKAWVLYTYWPRVPVLFSRWTVPFYTHIDHRFLYHFLDERFRSRYNWLKEYYDSRTDMVYKTDNHCIIKWHQLQESVVNMCQKQSLSIIMVLHCYNYQRLILDEIMKISVNSGH